MTIQKLWFATRIWTINTNSQILIFRRPYL